MSYSIVPKIRRDGTITLEDGAGATLEIDFEDGDFSFSEPNQYSEIVTRNRGDITSVRYGDEQVITGQFSFQFREFTDSSQAGSARDFVRKQGFYALNTSVNAPKYSQHYAINVIYDAFGLVHNDDADHQAKLTQCVFGNCDFSEEDPSKFVMAFTCYGGAGYLGPT